MASPVTIHLVRHAQGFHNLPREPGGPNPHNLPDPSLTDLGKQQCEELRLAFPYHDKVTHLVASPMRRTLYTCMLAFAPAVEAGKKIVALPLIQEASTNICDIGSPPERLAAEFPAGDDKVDLRLVTPGWNDKGPDSPWAPEVSKLDARARAARMWLRDLAARAAGEGGAAAAGETHIVVVTHGGFLHFLNQDWDGMAMDAGTGWKNVEYRSYEFADPSGQDPDAKLQETSDSWQRRRGDTIPLTETEQMELKAVIRKGLQEEYDKVENDRCAREREARETGTEPAGSPPTVYIAP